MKIFTKSWESIFDASSVDINAIDKFYIVANNKYENQLNDVGTTIPLAFENNFKLAEFW